MESFLNVVCVFFDLEVMLTLSVACGILLSNYLKICDGKKGDLAKITLLGTAILPFIITVLGYLRFFKIPYSALFILFASIGVILHFYKYNRNVFKCDKQTIYCLSGFITFIALLIFYAKKQTLHGNIAIGDDLKTMALTATLSANYLKPAYLYDFSIPLSYNYYLYIISGFTYLLRDGGGPTSLSTLSLTLYSLVIHCASIWLFLCSSFWKKHRFSTAFILLVYLAFSFSGLDYHVLSFVGHKFAQWNIEWWNCTQISSMFTFLSWNYQYLTASHMALGGSFLLLSGLDESNTHRGKIIAGSIMICASGGYGMFTFAASFGAIASIVVILFIKSKDKTLFAKNIACGTVGLIMLLPLIPCFVGRGPALIFFTTSPRWFVNINPHPPYVYYNEARSIFPWSISLFRHIWEVFVEFGFFVVIGIVNLFWPKKKTGISNIIWGLRIACIVEMFLMFFTKSRSYDWHARGPGLLISIIGICGFAIWLWDIFENSETYGKQRSFVIVTCLILLAPMLYNSVWDIRWQGTHECIPGFLEDWGREVRSLVPLHTPIMCPPPKEEEHSYYRPFFKCASSGRQTMCLIDENSVYNGTKLVGLAHYKNRIPFLQKYFGIDVVGSPKNKTWYGAALNSNTYYKILHDKDLHFIKKRLR